MKYWRTALIGVVVAAAVACGVSLTTPRAALAQGGFPTLPMFQGIGLRTAAYPPSSVSTGIAFAGGSALFNYHNSGGIASYLTANEINGLCTETAAAGRFYITAGTNAPNAVFEKAASCTAGSAPTYTDYSIATCPTATACSVSSSSALRTSSAIIQLNGTSACSVSSSISNVASCTRSAAGDYQIAFSTAYTSTTSYTCTATPYTETVPLLYGSEPNTAGIVYVFSYTVAGAASDSSVAVNLQCVGT